jgi:hypothetical protein
VTRATAAATHTTAATEMATTAGSMPTAAAASMPTAAATVATTTFIGRVGRGRQRSRKNNDGNPESERRHNFLRPVQTFVARIPLMFIIAAGTGHLH